MVLDAFDQMLEDLEELGELDDEPKNSTQQPVTLLFLDINMPVVDGLETAK